MTVVHEPSSNATALSRVEQQQSCAVRPPEPGTDFPVVGPHQTLSSVTDTISSIVLTRPTPIPWYAAFLAGLVGMDFFAVASTWLFYRGVGVFGINIPVAWGYAIANFVWWVGIGHAGTLISAILLLLNQGWRNSINRFAEAMTMCTGMYPVFHLGRPWLLYWLLSYPYTMQIQPQYRSPLVWDIFAVSTYAIVSVLFWYFGMIPDLATFRDRAQRKGVKRFYGVLALGWRGASRHWRWHETASLLLAGLATPLVLSVHTVVSFDFTIAILPGWHSTIFPPYFVAGAIYSGFAMVLILCIPLRAVYHASACTFCNFSFRLRLNEVRKRPLLPLHAPNLEEALQHAEPQAKRVCCAATNRAQRASASERSLRTL